MVQLDLKVLQECRAQLELKDLQEQELKEILV
jgi:hypothetical protein